MSLAAHWKTSAESPLRPDRARRFSPRLAVTVLALMSLAALWPVLGNGFVNLDDGTYVIENPVVLGGVTGEGLRWAATTRHAANWHPLTWLSHMADVQLFGRSASGHHLTSLLVHGGAAILLFAALCGMTGAGLRSFFVAALFAAHPLHVESVAWVSERKDLLAGLFWMATLAAYLHYVRRPRAGRYLLVLAFFTAGLLSKPTVVTLPLVLLLLDYWPLGRIVRGPRERPVPAATSGRVVLEKIPLLALSAAASAVTYGAQLQAGAVQTLEQQGLAHRISDALLAYAGYIGKMLWPQGLSAVTLSRDIVWPDWRVAGCLVLLFGLSALSVFQARRRPHAFAGWWWYVGTLVPVIGVVKVGAQAMADRYTYVPLVGLFVALVWGVVDAQPARPLRKVLVGAAGGAALLACVALSGTQAGYWRDSATLFGHALVVSPGNWAARHLYALALAKQGDYPGATANAVEAFRISGKVEQLEMVGDFLEFRRKDAEAATLFADALGVRPDEVEVRYRLANALLRLERRGQAIAHYEALLRAKPDHHHAHNNLGVALHGAGRVEAAVDQYRAALRVDPHNAEAHNNLGVALRGLGRAGEAESHFRDAVRDKPAYPAALHNLAGLLEAQGRTAESAAWRRKAGEIEQSDREAQTSLARVHGR